MELNQNWQVHDLSLYNTYMIEDTEDTGLGVSLLIPLDTHHRNSGGFRMILYGGSNETISIPANAVFAFLPPPIADSILLIPCSSVRTVLPENSTACPWRSVENMIRKNMENGKN